MNSMQILMYILFEKCLLLYKKNPPMIFGHILSGFFKENEDGRGWGGGGISMS